MAIEYGPGTVRFGNGPGIPVEKIEIERPVPIMRPREHHRSPALEVELVAAVARGERVVVVHPTAAGAAREFEAARERVNEILEDTGAGERFHQDAERLAWDHPDVDPVGDMVEHLARAIERSQFNETMRQLGTSIADLSESFGRFTQILQSSNWASLMRERSFMAVEAAGGRRPLVGEERAAHWRARLEKLVP